VLGNFVSEMMWRITVSCWIAFGEKSVCDGIVVGKVYFIQMTGRVMSLNEYFLSSTIRWV